MESVEFFNMFYKIKTSSNQVGKRSTESLYGLSCGLLALETGDFSILSKTKIANESEFLRWFDGVIEAMIIKNGNGDMVKTVSRMVSEILNHSPFCTSTDMLIERMYSCTNNHLLIDHFETFFRLYRELLNHRNEMHNSPAIAEAVYIFIKNNRDFEKVSFFDETLMPLILQFDQDFINSLEKSHFDRLLSGNINHARTIVKYLVHIAKNMNRSNRKKIMAYLNLNGDARKFIRIRGVRRTLKQVFGQRITGFDIYRHQQWTTLNKKQQILFEKPCKMFGRFQNKVILEIGNRQYLFLMNEEKEIFFWSNIKRKVKPEETDAFFADDII